MFSSEFREDSDELVPVRTIQKNSQYNYQGFRAFDKDLSTAANVVLVDNEIWIQFEFDKVYFIDQLFVFSYYYTDWHDPLWWCVADHEKYSTCKAAMSHVTINVYEDSRFVKRCGTLVMSEGLSQADQTYTFECAAAGNAVVLSKVHSEMFLALNEIVITTNRRKTHSHTASRLTVGSVELDPPSRWSQADPALVIDNKVFGRQATSDSSPVYIMLILEAPSVVTEVSLFKGDTTTLRGVRVYVIDSANEQVLCGIADDVTLEEHYEDNVYWGQKYPVKCSLRVKGKAVRVESEERITDISTFSVPEIRVFGYGTGNVLLVWLC